MEEIPNLPKHIIDVIFDKAQLSIDQRLSLKIKPKCVIVNEEFVNKITTICTRRKQCWDMFITNNDPMITYPLDSFYGTSWSTGPLSSMNVHICITYVDNEMKMMIELNETIDPDPEDEWAHLGGELFSRRATFCTIHDGMICSRFVDDSEDGDGLVDYI